MACMVATITRSMPKLAHWSQRHGQNDSGTVGIGDDKPVPSSLSLLASSAVVDGPDSTSGTISGIVRFHAVIARIGNHDMASRSKGAFDIPWQQRRPLPKKQASERCRAAIRRPSFQRHRQAYRHPAATKSHPSASYRPERSLAPSHVSLNHGWPCKKRMKCWPTMPVPPRIPTSIVFIFCRVHVSARAFPPGGGKYPPHR